MQTVDTREIDRLVESWDRLLKQFPEAKRRALEQMGRDLLVNVREEIGGSGKVAGWQEPHMGSGGGYVAVRAKAKTYQTTKRGKRYAVGYVTNSVEGGHRHGGRRGSSKKGYRYRPRYKTAAVSGKWFYQAVRQDVANMSQSEVNDLIQAILNGLEGRL